MPWEPTISQIFECIWTEPEIAQWNVKSSVSDCSIDPKVTTIVTRNFRKLDVKIQVKKCPYKKLCQQVHKTRTKRETGEIERTVAPSCGKTSTKCEIYEKTIKHLWDIQRLMSYRETISTRSPNWAEASTWAHLLVIPSTKRKASYFEWGSDYQWSFI